MNAQIGHSIHLMWLYFLANRQNAMQKEKLRKICSSSYKVEHQILPVVFFFDEYDMLRDIELNFYIETIQTFIK